MSPRSSTTRPCPDRSFGQVARKPLGQWSQRPGASTKPYSSSSGYSPKAQCRSVPAAEVMCIVFAAASCLPPASTRARSASFGTIRASTSGGSTASRMRVPPCRISICSGENSNVIRSSTRSLAFSAARAARLPVRRRRADKGQFVPAERALAVHRRQVQPVDDGAQTARRHRRRGQRLRMRVRRGQDGHHLPGLELREGQHLGPGIQHGGVTDRHGALLRRGQAAFAGRRRARMVVATSLRWRRMARLAPSGSAARMAWTICS